MKRILFSMLFVALVYFPVNGQTSSCQTILYLAPGADFAPTYFPIHTSGIDTIRLTVSDTEYYHLYIQDCQGAMKFQAFANGRVCITGTYVNSPDTLKHCVVVDDGHDPNQPMSVQVEEYFEPLKDGVWKYYDQGVLVKEELWQRGIKLK